MTVMTIFFSVPLKHMIWRKPGMADRIPYVHVVPQSHGWQLLVQRQSASSVTL